MADTVHPIAIAHLPVFITAPGETDWLFNVVVVVLLIMVLIIGNLYFQLHALPEQMAHRSRKVQMELVGVLALISLFTHNHIFWIAGLLLAMIDFPDFSSPLASIAESLEKLSGRGELQSGSEVEESKRVIVASPADAPKTESVDEGSHV